MKKYVIDGIEIKDFRSMACAFADAVNAPDGYFGTDIPSFDDCFFGYVHFEKPCEFIWKDAHIARNALDCKQLEQHWLAFTECEFYGEHAKAMVQAARQGKQTLFEDVVSFIRSVGVRNIHHRVLLTLEIGKITP